MQRRTFVAPTPHPDSRKARLCLHDGQSPTQEQLNVKQ